MGAVIPEIPVIALVPMLIPPSIVPPANGKFKLANPVKLAVIVPAEKLLDPSRKTIVFVPNELVAVVAELLTFPLVEIVANFASVIVASVISALTIKLELKAPLELL